MVTDIGRSSEGSRFAERSSEIWSFERTVTTSVLFLRASVQVIGPQRLSISDFSFIGLTVVMGRLGSVLIMSISFVEAGIWSLGNLERSILAVSGFRIRMVCR